jgi:bifunctional non-homologous end joining protein LigD
MTRNRKSAPGPSARRELPVSIRNADKPWWPDEGITKGDVARFYDDVSDYILPWTAERPLVAERCPDGMLGSCFFQKNFARGLPADVPVVSIKAQSTGRDVRYVVGGSEKALLSLVNLGCIAIHTMNCRVTSLEQPDWLAFDLDPSSGEFSDAAKAGRLLYGILEDLGVRSYPKTSGARGLHVFVPLRRGPDQDAVRAFARDVGALLAERAPDAVTVHAAKSARGGRVYLDAQRNAFGQTIVAPYSVRRRPKAPVSTPLAWDEVRPSLDPARFNIRTMARRLDSADPWADFWRRGQALPDLRRARAGAHRDNVASAR